MPIFTKNAQKGVDEDIEEQINTFEITFKCSHSYSTQKGTHVHLLSSRLKHRRTLFVKTEMNLLKVSFTYDYVMTWGILFSSPLRSTAELKRESCNIWNTLWRASMISFWIKETVAHKGTSKIDNYIQEASGSELLDGRHQVMSPSVFPFPYWLSQTELLPHKFSQGRQAWSLISSKNRNANLFIEFAMRGIMLVYYFMYV